MRGWIILWFCGWSCGRTGGATRGHVYAPSTTVSWVQMEGQHAVEGARRVMSRVCHITAVHGPGVEDSLCRLFGRVGNEPMLGAEKPLELEPRPTQTFNFNHG